MSILGQFKGVCCTSSWLVNNVSLFSYSKIYSVKHVFGLLFFRLNCKENIVIDLNIVPTQSSEVFEPEYQTNEDLSIVGESIVQVPEPSRTAVGWKKR